MDTLKAIARKLTEQRTRGYFYRVATAGGVVAAGYGVITGEELALWTGLVGAVFALPAVNTPVRP